MAWSKFRVWGFRGIEGRPFTVGYTTRMVKVKLNFKRVSYRYECNKKIYGSVTDFEISGSWQHPLLGFEGVLTGFAETVTLDDSPVFGNGIAHDDLVFSALRAAELGGAGAFIHVVQDLASCHRK